MGALRSGDPVGAAYCIRRGRFPGISGALNGLSRLRIQAWQPPPRRRFPLSDYRSQSSSELSWSAVIGMIAGTILVVVVVISMLNAASRKTAPPPGDEKTAGEAKPAAAEKRRFKEEQLEAEVKRLREE